LDTKSTEELSSSSRKVSKFEEAIKTELDQVVKAPKPTKMILPGKPTENNAKTASAMRDVARKEVTGAKTDMMEPSDAGSFN
jgi:hypothetical protein